jgi:hypothetical protein
MVAQIRHLDTVSAEALVVDQPFGQRYRLRRTFRFNVDLALEALEAMAVRTQEVLVEGDTIACHGDPFASAIRIVA